MGNRGGVWGDTLREWLRVESGRVVGGSGGKLHGIHQSGRLWGYVRVPEHKFNGRILATLANYVRVSKSILLNWKTSQLRYFSYLNLFVVIY